MNVPVPPPEEVASPVGSNTDDYKWHATERNLGSIEAIKGNLTILATDGNLGAFVDSTC
jgi:hypothetical protein